MKYFNRFNKMPHLCFWLTLHLFLLQSTTATGQSGDVESLIAAMLGDTPLIQNLQSLTDEIGGRVTGSEANLKSVEWGLQKFTEAGVRAWKEAFTMPALWLENSASAEISGDVTFKPRVVAMPFSAATLANAASAPLIDGGYGTDEDFQRIKSKLNGAFILIETHELLDLDGLFREYAEAVAIEKRAFNSGIRGLVYMSSRPQNLLYRHNASFGPNNKYPLLIMEREGAKRALRLLRAGKNLNIDAAIDVQAGGSYESYNVIAEIRGSEKPDEIVLIGAHIDSWALGTGANDNGCNVALVIDLARQIKRLGLKPKRTIRFALFNGEEQGLVGSWGYTKTHADELDNHIMASSCDIGSGRTTGFFANGPGGFLEAVARSLEPVAGLGPFVNINAPIVGTDNYDFMMQGVANLVANQESANYGPNYHARSDTYDKVNLIQLKLNAAIAAAVTYGFAQMEITWERQNRTQLEKLIQTTDLEAQMKSMGLWQSWVDGTRGRSK